MSALRRAAALIAVACALALSGCVPEPAETATGTGSPAGTASATAQSPSAPATPAATASAADAADAVAVPADCAALYSPEMTRTLNQQLPPLNDPGVTLLSSQNSAALETLNSGVPTLRCSWGAPGEAGLATNVSIIGADAAGALRDALAEAGFGCADTSDGGVECSIEQETIDLDDNLVTTGEQHYFRSNGWISTAWVGVIPDGYTRDVAGRVWG